MLARPFLSAAAFASAAVAMSLLAAVPATAAATKNPIEIREWEVPYDGRPRDPFAAGSDQVWFVGQVNGYLGRLTPSTGEFFKRELGDDAGPHNLIVDDDGIVWFAGNLNAYIGAVCLGNWCEQVGLRQSLRLFLQPFLAMPG